VLANITITNSTIWSTSLNCDRLQVDSHLFYRLNSTAFAPVNNNMSLITSWISIDANLTTLLTNSGSIWNYSPNINGYTLFFNGPSPFPTGSQIYTAMNSIIISGSNTTAAWALAFAISPSGQLTNCLNYTFNNFNNAPMI
jgi:hypothetical protein